MNMEYNAIVVGGGVAGLTASAYLAKAGIKTLLCEKEDKCGGLVNAFKYEGFTYDGGIRAMENSGVLFPMLRHLGLNVEFVKNNISLGIEDKVIRVHSEDSIVDYQNLLTELYPQSKEDISNIIAQIRRIMHYMEIQYGIDNPAFLDPKADRDYMVKKILPWMFKYAFTFRKIAKLNEPVIDFLKHFTDDPSLLDIITQHFFQQTPAFFALSYIKLYLDYHYPLGGTGRVIEKLLTFIEDHQGSINTNTEIVQLDVGKNLITDVQGNTYRYQMLIWAADQKSLYRITDLANIRNDRVKTEIMERRKFIDDKSGNDSIFTSFLGVDLDKGYFASRASEHFFYTPSRKGQTEAGPLPVGKNRESIKKWLENFFALTTYEISIPVLRDAALAPTGKTGLIVSVLFDYGLTKHIQETGWYDEFKSFAETCIIRTLDLTVYPGIQKAILHKFSSSPLTMQRLTGNSDGAITGWAFTNQPMPAESRLPKIFSATQTPIPGILQAGQWTYSPSGLPISILTGKLAADRAIKDFSKKQ
jgi:phytoene dehydrogenase-like protein